MAIRMQTVNTPKRKYVRWVQDRRPPPPKLVKVVLELTGLPDAVEQAIAELKSNIAYDSLEVMVVRK